MATHTTYDSQLFLALGKFKTVRNWPDLNACLQNIIDVFQSFPEVPYVSHKLLFAKTLSQCLSPALPAGIQTKTLDVYNKVFGRVSGQALVRDFYVWGPGLLQFFHYAGVAQRVIALKLFDDHIVPLIERNKRIAPAVILAVLPGLSDEGTELPSRVNDMLVRINVFIGDGKFWSAMFRTAITSPVTRMPCLAYALKAETSGIMAVDNAQLQIAFWTALFNDANPLVARSGLELFNICFTFLDKQVKSDLGCKCVVLMASEDLSIRRRVFNWVGAFPKDAAESMAFAPTSSVKVAIERGGSAREMAIDSLPTLMASKEFDVAKIADLVDADVLLASSRGNFGGQIRVLKQLNPRREAKAEALTSVLSSLHDSTDFETVCLVGCLLTEAAGEEHEVAAMRAVELIFAKYQHDDQALVFASMLVTTLGLTPDFRNLLKEPVSFLVIQTIIQLSRRTLTALMVLDDSVELFSRVCWKQLADADRKALAPDLCRALVVIYRQSPSGFAIGLSDHWDPRAVRLFVCNSLEVPISVVITTQRKNAESGGAECDLLRLLASRAELLMGDVKKLARNDDPEFTCVVISSLEALIETGARLFLSGFSQQALIDFVKFLLTLRRTARLVNAILVASEDAEFLTAVSDPVYDYIIANPRDIWAHKFIAPITNYNSRISELVELIADFPDLLSSVLDVLERVSSAREHFEVVELTCSKVVQLLGPTTLGEPLLHDISRMFKLISKRIETEMAECRSSMKSSTIRRILTTIEELSADDCVASLTVRYMPDYSALYSSITPTYLPVILKSIWHNVDEDSASRLLVPFFSLFEPIWRLSLFFSMAVVEGLQQPLLISCLLPLMSDDQILDNIRNLIFVLSYDDQVNRPVFMSFMEVLVASRTPALACDDTVSLFAGMFQSLRIAPFLVVHFICEYMKTFPNVSIIAFQQPFINAVSDVKGSPEDLIGLVSYLCSVDSACIATLFSMKSVSVLVRTFLLCDKTTLEYPKLIATFGNIADTYNNWTECVISVLSNPKLFGCGRDYLLQTLRAINIISRKSDRFVPQIFDFLSPKSEIFWKFGSKEFSGIRKIRLLSFVILGCDFDIFATRQQNINGLLVHSLSLDNTEIAEFRAFSLLMRVMFIRFSQKFIESFSSIMVNEITDGLSRSPETRKEAKRLLQSALRVIPAAFQFAEFAFIPDMITFPDKEILSDERWPILRTSTVSLQYLSDDPLNRDKYEALLLAEFMCFADDPPPCQ